MWICLNLIVFALFYIGKLYTDIFCLQIFPSITYCIMYFEIYADEMYHFIEIKFSSSM